MPGRERPQEAESTDAASEGTPLLVDQDAARGARQKVLPKDISKAELLSRIFPFNAWRPLLIVVSCSIFVLVARLVSLRYLSQMGRGFYGQYGADQWVLSLFPNQTSGFFLDIGAYDGEHMSNTKLLEERGWRGVCADPFPHNFVNRHCTVVAQPVGPVGGVRERLADCSEGFIGFLHRQKGDDMLSGIKRYTNVFGKQVASCPERDMDTVGVADLLAVGKAPPIIDYVNLDTEGAELHILEGFPFDRHCVRSWTVEHNCEEPKQTKIKELLESRGCRVTQVEVDWWAMCPCGDEHSQELWSVADEAERQSSAFETAFNSEAFFVTPKSERKWTGRVAQCMNHQHSKTGI